MDIKWQYELLQLDWKKKVLCSQLPAHTSRPADHDSHLHTVWAPVERKL